MVNTSQHIGRQNQTVADFENQALAPWRAGTITGQMAIDRIEGLAADFEGYAAQLGYERAMAGARDVRNLAETLKQSIRSGAEFSPTTVVLNGGDVTVALGGSGAGPQTTTKGGGLGTGRSAAAIALKAPWLVLAFVGLLVLRPRRKKS